MKAVYLLPCSCGKKIPVDAGQAGARISCECGQQLNVPTFRSLKNLEQAAPVAVMNAAAAGSSWSTTRGIFFSLGMLATVVAALVIAYNLFFWLSLLGEGDAWKDAHLQEMQAGVDYLSPADAVAEFQAMADKGLTVDGIPPWSSINNVRDSSRSWVTAGLIALAMGVVLLFASLLSGRSAKPR